MPRFLQQLFHDLNTSFLTFVTKRYLKGVSGRKEGSNFLRFVTLVAIGGIATGVAALLLALSIVRGFSNEIETKIIGFGAHIQIESIEDAPIDNAAEIAETIRTDYPEAASVTLVVEEFGLLRVSKTAVDGIRLSGTDQLPQFVADNIIQGTSSYDTDGQTGIIVGKSLADDLGADVGDDVVVFSLRDTNSGQTYATPDIRKFTVSGIFETSLADYDKIVAYASIEDARDLFNYGDAQASRIDVVVKESASINDIASRIEDQVGFPLMVRTIYEVFQSIFAWVRLQESIIPVVISVIVIVAAFNVVGTMLMILLEKTTDIGVLMSLGASGGTIKKLFVSFGLGLGLIGTVTGSLLALTFAVIQKRYEIIPLPAESYYMDTAPIEIAATDFLLVSIITLILCVLAAYIPARVASRIEPVSVIRFH